jgi:hypothetical protein
VRLYVDTFGLGALIDPGDERPTVVTRRLLREVLAGVHEAAISNIVQEELERAPGEIRRAILHEVRLVSWNFRHLVNLRTRRAVHSVNVRLGNPLLEIVSPEEV